MPTKKPARRERTPSRAPRNVKVLPNSRAETTPASASENGLLLELAMAFYSSATSTKDPAEVTIARLLDAVWLMHRRRERATETAARERDDIDRAAAKYLRTRDDRSERWAFAALPPDAYNDRTRAINELGQRAADGIALLRRHIDSERERSKDPASATGLRVDPKWRPAPEKAIANVLLAKVEELGLAADQVDRTDRRNRVSDPNAWPKLLEELLSERPRVDRVTALALRCRGVSRTAATNWTRTLIDMPIR